MTMIVVGVVLGALGAVGAARYQRRLLTRRGDAEAAARVNLGRRPRYH